jgi:hypothetical protein
MHPELSNRAIVSKPRRGLRHGTRYRQALSREGPLARSPYVSEGIRGVPPFGSSRSQVPSVSFPVTNRNLEPFPASQVDLRSRLVSDRKSPVKI